MLGISDLADRVSHLDPADHRGMDPASVGDLFLGQTEPFPRLAQSGAEGNHAASSVLGPNLHRKLRRFSGNFPFPSAA